MKRQFKLLDLDASGKLSESEFAKAIQDLRLDFVNQDIKTLFKIFDRNNDGTIDSEEFLNQVIGELSGIRRDIIQKVFAKLDPYQHGAVSMTTIRNEFDPSRHPDCKTGKKSPEEVLGEFIESFQSHHLVTNAYTSSSQSGSSDLITYPAFEEYFKFISAGITSDAQFDVLMTNIWNLDLKNNVDARPFAGSK